MPATVPITAEGQPGVGALLRYLRELGPEVTATSVTSTYQRCHQLLQDSDYGAPRVRRDLAYGPDPRQRVDVHCADRPDGPDPVLVFVHGGGFTGGARHTPGSPFYDHVGGWAVRRGLVAATVGYRLAPAATWPDAARDVADAVTMVRDRADTFGGDPDRVVLVGHSAGAVHVASYLAGHAGPLSEGIAAAVLLSGLYDLPRARRDSSDPTQTAGFQAYSGVDDAQLPGRSALPGLLELDLPVLFGVAQLDSPVFQRQVGSLLHAWLGRHGTLPPLLQIAGHDHFSGVLTLGVDPDGLDRPLTRFLDTVVGRAAADVSGTFQAAAP